MSLLENLQGRDDEESSRKPQLYAEVQAYGQYPLIRLIDVAFTISLYNRTADPVYIHKNYPTC